MTGQQLKNSILQMAVQGKLVPQDPNDEPASVLLERIRAEKEALIKNGKIKKEKIPSVIFRGADNLPYEKVGKNEPVCIADEVPFDIPDSWEWVRLKDLTIKDIKRGKSPKYADYGSVYVFAQKCNVKLGGIDISLAKFLNMNTFEKYPVEEYMIDEDIVINSTGNGTLGRIGMFHDADRINDFIIVPDSHVTIIRACNQLKKDYIFYTLKYYQPFLEKLGEGSTNQTELRPSTVAELFIPIPPIDEQERIVEKLLEVLPMADMYGTKETALKAYNTNFPVQLKKSILQEAVQGKLVPQDENDEPASVLLERIRAEKQALIKAGKIKKDKNESVIFRRDNSHYEKLNGIERCIDDEIPFEIPDNWCWCRLSNIMNVVSAKRVHQSDWRKSGIPFYRAREIGKLCEQGYVDNELFISEELFRLFSQNGVPQVDDIMVTAVGTLGKTYVVKETDRFYYKDASVICFENFGKINPFYIQLVMASPYMSVQIKENSSGTTVGTITISTAKQYFIPVPPLAEQHRIVDAYNTILPYIEQL